MKTKGLLFAMLLFCSLFLCAQKTKTTKETKFPERSTYSHSKLSYKLIPAANNTYGYDIYSEGKLIVHQPTMPGIPGNEGFKTKDGAEKVAQLVTAKIEKGEMPPTVTPEEMKKLKVLP